MGDVYWVTIYGRRKDQKETDSKHKEKSRGRHDLKTAGSKKNRQPLS